jgi:phosphoribosyl 1,2-cyclic phosphodiesterase
MRVTIWGCRGSLATPGVETVRYGGNTSCVEVSTSDERTALVLDAGTGIRRLGLELAERGVEHVHLCLTHLHLDHLEGLRFFAPLWDERITLDVWGPPSPVVTLRERIARSFSPPLFPIDLRRVPARVSFRDIPRQPWTIDGVTLSAELVMHPGPTVGFRVEDGGATLAYLPDHEPALVGPIADRTRDWLSGGSIAADADVLLHDAQYFADEYDDRIGWGHSSVEDAVTYAHMVGARRLVLFHHEPDRGDSSLERLGAQARLLAAEGESEPVLAREGMVLELA